MTITLGLLYVLKRLLHYFCATPFSTSFCRAVGLISFRNSLQIKGDKNCKYFIPIYFTTLLSFTPAVLSIYICLSLPFCFLIWWLSQETPLSFPEDFFYEEIAYVFFFYVLWIHFPNWFEIYLPVWSEEWNSIYFYSIPTYLNKAYLVGLRIYSNIQSSQKVWYVTLRPGDFMFHLWEYKSPFLEDADHLDNWYSVLWKAFSISENSGLSHTHFSCVRLRWNEARRN